MSQRDNAHTNEKAAAECSQQSGGKYTIEISPLSNNVDISRELLVRRLAAGDKNIDLINMDTIWTPEFAEAGWLRELKGAEKEDALDDVLAGPAESVQWEGKTYGIPLEHERAAALVPQGPGADAARDVGRDDRDGQEAPGRRGQHPRAGQQVRGLRRVVQQPRRVRRRRDRGRRGPSRRSTTATTKALEIIRNVANSGRVDPSLSTMQEDHGAARLPGRQGRLHAQLAVRLRVGARRRRRRATRPPRRCSTTWPGRASRASTRASRARSRSAARTSASRTTARIPRSRRRPRCA